jgi:uncharacterized membrane protein
MELQKESHARSLIKGLTWRVLATGAIIVIAFLTTGDVKIAFTIGAWEFFIKLGMYYVHERIWQMVPRGTFRNLFQSKKT